VRGGGPGRCGGSRLCSWLRRVFGIGNTRDGHGIPETPPLDRLREPRQSHAVTATLTSPCSEHPKLPPVADWKLEVQLQFATIAPLDLVVFSASILPPAFPPNPDSYETLSRASATTWLVVMESMRT
jgi:hypothetical protein